MRTILFTLLFTLSSMALPAMAEMYRWVDEKGNVHYSDKAPSDEAEQYEPPPILVVPAGPSGKLKPLEKEKDIKYESLSITSPANDTVFTPDKANDIEVAIAVTPRIDAEHNIALYVDGQLHTVARTLVFILNGLPRGTHTVSASVMDKDNKKLISSNSVSFHVRRHHIK
jgi:hypothetical protein